MRLPSLAEVRFAHLSRMLHHQNSANVKAPETMQVTISTTIGKSRGHCREQQQATRRKAKLIAKLSLAKIMEVK